MSRDKVTPVGKRKGLLYRYGFNFISSLSITSDETEVCKNFKMRYLVRSNTRRLFLQGNACLSVSFSPNHRKYIFWNLEFSAHRYLSRYSVERKHAFCGNCKICRPAAERVQSVRETICGSNREIFGGFSAKTSIIIGQTRENESTDVRS